MTGVRSWHGLLVTLYALALCLACGLTQSTRDVCRDGNYDYMGNSGQLDTYELACNGLLPLVLFTEQRSSDPTVAPRPYTAEEQAFVLATCAYQYEQLLKCDQKNPLPFSGQL